MELQSLDQDTPDVSILDVYSLEDISLVNNTTEEITVNPFILVEDQEDVPLDEYTEAMELVISFYRLGILILLRYNLYWSTMRVDSNVRSMLI